MLLPKHMHHATIIFLLLSLNKIDEKRQHSRTQPFNILPNLQGTYQNIREKIIT